MIITPGQVESILIDQAGSVYQTSPTSTPNVVVPIVRIDDEHPLAAKLDEIIEKLTAFLEAHEESF